MPILEEKTILNAARLPAGRQLKLAGKIAGSSTPRQLGKLTTFILYAVGHQSFQHSLKFASLTPNLKKVIKKWERTRDKLSKLIDLAEIVSPGSTAIGNLCELHKKVAELLSFYGEVPPPPSLK